jgi:hypothetical protein
MIAAEQKFLDDLDNNCRKIRDNLLDLMIEK